MGDVKVEWVMSDATTPAERIAYLHWMETLFLFRGHFPAEQMSQKQALEKSFDSLPLEERDALIALAQRAPKDIGFVNFIAPTPGAQIAKD